MNIFEVLSQGKSRLHEPSVSAMLGYLLDPLENHGIGDIFLRDFLKMLDENSERKIFIESLEQNHRINAIIELEVQYPHLLKKNDIDIQIQILDHDKEIHRIIIENKIRASSASPKQLMKYYKAILNDPDYKNALPKVTVVFLTPDTENAKLSLEFSNLINLEEGHNKLWINWTNENVNKSLLHLVKEILQKEISCEINPINEYMRHTIKGFVNFLSAKTSKSESKKMRTGQDIGNITDEVEIRLENGKEYIIIRRDSTQIQVFDKSTEEKQVARHIMAEYIDENGLEIEHNRYNTRTIGKKLLEILDAK